MLLHDTGDGARGTLSQLGRALPPIPGAKQVVGEARGA